MATEKIHAGYVATEGGEVLVQVPDDNRWGFYLADDDQSWDGGFGVAASWEAIADDDPRIADEVRERLEHIVEHARSI